jgi:hypothetical protein
MNERQLAAQLRREGFSHTYVWEDGANAFYPEHTHPMETAHIILDGEMTLNMNGKAQTLRAGARLRCSRGHVSLGQNGSVRLPLPDWRALNYVCILVHCYPNTRFVVILRGASFAPRRISN